MGLNPRLRQVGIGAVLVLIAAAVVWSLLGVYSEHTYQSFLAPTRRLLAAGVAQDSAELVSAGAPVAVIRWTLAAGRQNPALLRTLERTLYVGYGMRKGDTTLVLFGARVAGLCANWPLTVIFVGAPAVGRIEKVTGGCDRLGPGPAGASQPS